MATRRSLLGGLVLLGAGGAGAWFLRDSFFWPTATLEPGATDSGDLTLLETPTRLPLVIAGVNGQAVTALIDTGAQATSIDRSLAEALGLEAAFAPPLVALGAGGHRQVAEGVDVTLELAEMVFSTVRAAVVEIGPLSEPELGGVKLVIGQDVLQTVIIELDFEARTARLRDRAGAEVPAGMTVIPSRQRGRGLEARIRVEETVLDLLVDTGSTAGVSLSETTAENVGLLDGRETEASRRIVLGGVSSGRIVEARSLIVAGRALGASPVHIYGDQAAPGFPRGLLGLEIIGRERAWLDLAGGRLAVTGLPEPDERQ